MTGPHIPDTLPVAPPLRPEQFGPALDADLDDLDDAARAHVASKVPQNTADGYDQDWRTWERFTAEARLPVLAVRSGTLTAFVQWLWTQPGQQPGSFAAPSTIRRRLSGVLVTGRQRHGLTLPSALGDDAVELLARLVKDMERRGEVRGRGSANALMLDHLRAISAACPDTLQGLRDRSVVTMHFALTAREHEMAFLRVRHLFDQPEGTLADVRVSKTSPRVVAVPYAGDPLICPVLSWQSWRDGAGIAADPGGFAWRRVHWRGGNVLPGGLSPEAIGDIITRASARAGVQARMTGHSPRRGGASEARRGGKDFKVIALQGGWTPGSKALNGYLEIVDKWDDNAMKGVM